MVIDDNFHEVFSWGSILCDPYKKSESLLLVLWKSSDVIPHRDTGLTGTERIF